MMEKEPKVLYIDLSKKVIGIPLTECFMCGEKAQKTRHHAIARELNPKRNVTLPLCKNHKNVMHHVDKVMYVPRNIRKKINIAISEMNNAMGRMKHIRASFKIHKLHNYPSIK